MSIGDNIKQLRESHGLTQERLGQIAGVTDKAVSTWEAGKKVPRMGAVQKMSDYFNIPKSAILDEDIGTRFTAPTPPPVPSPILQTLSDALDRLNDEGQEKLVDYADDLVSSGKYKKHDPSQLGQKEA